MVNKKPDFTSELGTSVLQDLLDDLMKQKSTFAQTVNTFKSIRACNSEDCVRDLTVGSSDDQRCHFTSPSPLTGEGRDGGGALAKPIDGTMHTPHPVPPPQGGREPLNRVIELHLAGTKYQLWYTRGCWVERGLWPCVSGGSSRSARKDKLCRGSGRSVSDTLATGSSQQGVAQDEAPA